ncbi:MAG: ATP:cob(I)alamin adenosyltransferase [Anaerolineales bacterium]|nr:ATP:cob(I)alamin adenosyltransferase [Anaerolineales bacterium]
MTKPLRGDTGLTDLIDARDLPKHDLRFEVLGTLDEASSALGMVRASPIRPETRELILSIQRDLCWMMSELAALSDDRRPESRITPERLERRVTQLDQEAPLPNPHIISYLNRLSTLVYAMAHAEEAAAGITKPTVAHQPGGL